MPDWDFTFDFVVVGSGAGGLTAALTAHHFGLKPLVIEKSGYIGGSSALSGGGIWIPNNYLMAEKGIADSVEDAREYLHQTVGSRTSQARQEAYLQNAPQMLEFLRDHSQAHFMITPDYPDYYPELPGGKPGGRSLEPRPFNSRHLGRNASLVRPSNISPPLGMGVTAYEARHLYMLTRSPRAALVGMRVFFSNLRSIIGNGRRWTLGRALIGRLLQTVLEQQIPIWIRTAGYELVFQNNRIEGMIVEQGGRMLRIRAVRGVLLAAGGFEQNQQMREKFLPSPTSSVWSAGNPANTGDALRMGRTAGAALDLMDEAWWTPVSLPPDSPATIHIGERSFPRQIIVDRSGRRFTNEAVPYHQFGQTQYAHNQSGERSIPAFMIFDQSYRNRYLFGQTLPFLTPRKFLESGYLQRADTLSELAGLIGVDPDGLQRTVTHFNENANAGKDPLFSRGESLYDRYYGDFTVGLNPCLGPLDTPPYYAVALYPGDLGTKGGLLTDAHARVLKEDGAVLENLYACGNASASLMGTTYPGAGSTIGPAMTFGYLAACDAVE